ncbi:two-component regulator propeller domain-containing protein [Flavobacterium sp. LB3P45]|uniref:Two-component regulator propeller domain-containing protein n=1 Tax=Flavobacterium fructosi TaxID=3230416 RepID=A0ABW6HSC0_9FLAO
MFFWDSIPSKYYSNIVGLTSNAVRSLFLDSKNILWFGTENGVSKMENGSFSTFNEIDGLDHNDSWDFHHDSNGNMWFMLYPFLIPKTQRFKMNF